MSEEGEKTTKEKLKINLMERIIFALLAAITFGIYGIPFSKINKSPWSLILIVVGSAMVYLFISYMVGGKKYALTLSEYSASYFVGCVIIGSLLLGIGYYFYEKTLVGSNPQTWNAICTALIPVSAFISGCILEKHIPNIREIIGLLCVCGGVWLLIPKNI